MLTIKLRATVKVLIFCVDILYSRAENTARGDLHHHDKTHFGHPSAENFSESETVWPSLRREKGTILACIRIPENYNTTRNFFLR